MFFTTIVAIFGMSYETIIVSREPHIAIITLNRPDALNALNTKLADELIAALNELEKDDSIRCVIITGNERAFCAGADIKEMSNLSSPELIKSNHLFTLWEKVGGYPKPMVGALSGYTLGGGLELAMSCDILVASENTKLGQPEINIGIIPGGGGTQRLPRTVGKYKAMELILTGSIITAEEAKVYGLVNKVVSQNKLLDEAKKIATEIASKAPFAVKLAKQAINKAFEIGLSNGLDFERSSFYLLFSTEDKSEGMRAFLEKRKPEFKGK
jgi:enoyl-CoA hydratase